MTEEEKKELQANFDRIHKGTGLVAILCVVGFTVLAGLILMTKSK